MGDKPYTVTSTCRVCGCPVELVGGPKINVKNFQGAKEAECSVCTPQSKWKRVPGMTSVIDILRCQKCGREGIVLPNGKFHCEHCNPTKVHVVVFAYGGVVEAVNVFSEDHLKAAQGAEAEIRKSPRFREGTDTVGLYENVIVE